ncbi:MAG: hypothetical protein WKG06_19305 [Segetibacter sp.]
MDGWWNKCNEIKLIGLIQLHSVAVTTNTTNVSALAAPVTPNLSVSGADLICSGSSTYTLNGAPAGSVISWSTSNANIGSVPTPSNGTSVNVTKVTEGSIALTATVRTCNGVFSSIKYINLGIPVPGLTINGVAPYGAIDATVTTDAPPPYYWYVDGNFVKTTNEKELLIL